MYVYILLILLVRMQWCNMLSCYMFIVLLVI